MELDFLRRRWCYSSRWSRGVPLRCRLSRGEYLDGAYEKEWVIRRLQKDDGRTDKEMTFKGFLNAMQDWKIWVQGFIYL